MDLNSPFLASNTSSHVILATSQYVKSVLPFCINTMILIFWEKKEVACMTQVKKSWILLHSETQYLGKVGLKGDKRISFRSILIWEMRKWTLTNILDSGNWWNIDLESSKEIVIVSINLWENAWIDKGRDSKESYLWGKAETGKKMI